MIGKVSPRGNRVAGLIYYLYGPGRNEEHTDPHIVAGWRHPAELEPPLRDNSSRDFRRLNGLLQQPHAALGPDGFDRPVWHCSVRAAPGDRMLSDDEWARVAHNVMHRTGLAPYEQDDDAVRWVAVHHADDHIHIVAMLARQDGRRPRFWNDFYRVGEACHAAEESFRLRRTAPRDRTAPRRPTRAESEKAARHGRQEAARITLRRAVATAAAGAGNEQDFFARLQNAGVLVRKRLSSRAPGEVTGYAVALPTDTTVAGGPVWYGGGKLAADLTLPKIRHRWQPDQATVSQMFTAAECRQIWDHAARTARQAAQRIRHLTATDPAAAADAAWAAADTLHVAASALRSRVVRQAATAYERAARLPYGRVPPPTAAGNSLRQAARLMAAVSASGDPIDSGTKLLIRLVALAQAAADLRAAQQHHAQAAAARQAAEHLRAARVASRAQAPYLRVRARANSSRQAATSLSRPERSCAGCPPLTATPRPPGPVLARIHPGPGARPDNWAPRSDSGSSQ